MKSNTETLVDDCDKPGVEVLRREDVSGTRAVPDDER